MVEVEAKNKQSAPTPTPTPTPLTKHTQSPSPNPIIFSYHISGSGTVCKTGPLNNRSTNSGHNGSSFSLGGIGVNLKSLGVCGIGIGADLEMGVIGGDGGIIVLLLLRMIG